MDLTGKEGTREHSPSYFRGEESEAQPGSETDDCGGSWKRAGTRTQVLGTSEGGFQLC